MLFLLQNVCWCSGSPVNYLPFLKETFIVMLEPTLMNLEDWFFTVLGAWRKPGQGLSG